MLPLLRRASTTTGRFRTGYRTMSANPPDFKQFKLALIQLGRAPYLAENPTETEIKDANLKHARDMIDRAVKSSSGKPDLVVLPVRRSSVPPSLSIMTTQGMLQLALWPCILSCVCRNRRLYTWTRIRHHKDPESERQSPLRCGVREPDLAHWRYIDHLARLA